MKQYSKQWFKDKILKMILIKIVINNKVIYLMDKEVNKIHNNKMKVVMIWIKNKIIIVLIMIEIINNHMIDMIIIVDVLLVSYFILYL